MTKKISLFHLFAGILFAVLTLRQSYYFIRFLIDAIEYGYDSIFSTVVWYLLFVGIYALTTICLLIGAFLNRRSGLAKALPVIGLGALALAVLFSFIRGIYLYVIAIYDLDFLLVFTLPDLVSLAGCIVLVIFAAIMPSALTKNPKSKLRMLWFLPALLVLTSDFMTPVIGFLLDMYRASYIVADLFFNTLYVAAILFAGLGCAFPPVSEEKRAQPYGGPGPAYVPNPGYDPGTALLTGPDPVYGPGPAQVVDPSYLPPDPVYAPGPNPVYSPNPTYGPGPAYDPGTALLTESDPMYAPGPAPGPDPMYAPGPAYVPDPAYIPDPAPVPGPVQDNPPKISAGVVAELKQYKELLDMGVITQEEFDAKKKQLLGL